MTERGIKQWVGMAIFVSGLGVLSPPAWAQVTSTDQKCIAAFNKGLGKISKTQGKIVAKCVRDFAGGHLVSVTPEECLTADLFGRLNSTISRAVAASDKKCASGIPPFGTSPTTTGVPAAVVTEIDLLHRGLGSNLDDALVGNATVAACQSKVTAALVKCSDIRKREYVRCQKGGLRSGAISDAASLANTCLGTGDQTQPDPTGKIQRFCSNSVAIAIGLGCTGVDLADAFPACNVSTGTALTACLARESACRLCGMMNEADGLARDCDRFDDGNGANGTCGAECGDGIVQVEEACDDGGQNSGDGCSNACNVETGWTCSGSPSTCVPSCGNGVIDAGEECDDHGTANGDGCSSTCAVETGYTCADEPSVCTPDCGNGAIGAGETCDDGGHASGDGCSSTCQVEPGYVCSGTPSVCSFVCGNGTFQAGETCDDGDAIGGDGCSAVCQIEPGWLCSGQPSLCQPLCGDGLVRGSEGCDDGNPTSGDGCSFSCQVEAGYACVGTPSHCLPICGDGFKRGAETCDDGNTASGDGCSGVLCRQEVGWTCNGQPSVCNPNCGNGTLDPGEECDQGNLTNGDGCNSTCHTETGWACGGQPSVCTHTCGNGVLNGAEACDDGNTINGDGCSATCKNESGWVCPVLPGLPCNKFELFIDSPTHGIFSTAASIGVTGHYTTLLPGQVAVSVNGVTLPPGSVNQVTRTFSTTVPLSAPAIFNPINVTLTNTSNGDDVHARVVVIQGQSVADGAYSPQSVAMRINDTGLDTLEPLVGQLAASGLNLGALLPPGTVLTDQCFINAIGCWGSARVTIGSPAPSFSSLAFAADSKTNVVGADISVNNLRVNIDIDGSGLVPDCGLLLTANSMHLTGDYGLQPDSGDPSNVDVNLVTPISVNFAGFNRSFTYGICDAPIIGDIIQAFLPDIEQFAKDGIAGFLADPDGSGPQDSPIADGIETALAGISIAGPIGQGLGLMLSTPLFDVAEDNVGISFKSDSRFTVSVGNGPGQCIPPPGAPNFTASYSKSDVFPTFGATSPTLHTPYGLAIAISSAGFNQLLRGQTECGLMRTSLTQIDVDGAGGAPPLPITSTLLSLLVPEFAQLPANTPLRIDIAPTLAPVVSGNAGPNGELADLRIAHVSVQIVQPGPETVWLGGAFDARLGMNLEFDSAGLAISLAEPSEDDTSLTITYNPLGTNEAQLESVLPGVLTPLIPQLAGALSGFPLPEFFGLSLHGVEVSRTGQFLGLYANLAP